MNRWQALLQNPKASANMGMARTADLRTNVNPDEHRLFFARSSRAGTN